MLNKIKNVKLNLLIFTKVFSMIENTIQTCRDGGGKSPIGDNLRSNGLFRSNISLKTILFGLLISLLAMQCSTSSTTDPVATTPGTQSACQSGQTKQADGSCLADCVSPKILQNGVCVSTPSVQITSNSLSIGGLASSYKTISINANTPWNITGTVPSWMNISKTSGEAGIFSINLTALQANTTAGGVADVDRTASFNVTGTGVPTQTLTVTQVGRELCSGFEGPTVMLYKYLNKTNPNPPAGELISKENTSIAFMMAKGCKETNTDINWQSSQVKFDVLTYMNFNDGLTGITVKSLTFVSNTWDHAFVKDLQYNTFPIELSPKKFDGNSAGTSGRITFLVNGSFVINNCASPSCFIRLNNSFLSLSITQGQGLVRNLSGASVGNGGNGSGVDDYSAINSTDLSNPAKFDPYIKTQINQMFKDFAASPGVTWPSGWEASVLIP